MNVHEFQFQKQVGWGTWLSNAAHTTLHCFLRITPWDGLLYRIGDIVNVILVQLVHSLCFFQKTLLRWMWSIVCHEKCFEIQQKPCFHNHQGSHWALPRDCLQQVGDRGRGRARSREGRASAGCTSGGSWQTQHIQQNRTGQDSLFRLVKRSGWLNHGLDLLLQVDLCRLQWFLCKPHLFISVAEYRRHVLPKSWTIIMENVVDIKKHASNTQAPLNHGPTRKCPVGFWNLSRTDQTPTEQRTLISFSGNNWFFYLDCLRVISNITICCIFCGSSFEW